jgi:hypothetical protein
MTLYTFISLQEAVAFIRTAPRPCKAWDLGEFILIEVA